MLGVLLRKYFFLLKTWGSTTNTNIPLFKVQGFFFFFFALVICHLIRILAAMPQEPQQTWILEDVRPFGTAKCSNFLDYLFDENNPEIPEEVQPSGCCESTGPLWQRLEPVWLRPVPLMNSRTTDHPAAVPSQTKEKYFAVLCMACAIASCAAVCVFGF